MAEGSKDAVSEESVAPQKYFEDQFDDEEVLYVFRKHPVVMRKGLILCLLGPLAGILPAFFNPGAGFGLFFGGLGAGCVIGVLLIIPSWVSWYFSVFIVTDQRFIQITQRGFFHRSVADISLHQIQSINYEISGLQETLLGFGTINIQTYVGELIIHNLHHPAKIQKRLLGILRDENVSANIYPAVQDKKQQALDNKLDEEIEEA